MILLAEQYANGGVTYLKVNTFKDCVFENEDRNCYLKKCNCKTIATRIV